MFKLVDAEGATILVEADHWQAGVAGVVFTDSRGKIVDEYDWNEISDVNIERVDGTA